MNEKLEPVLRKHGSKILSGFCGSLWGTIDVVTSGYPIVTTLMPVRELFGFAEAQSYFREHSSVTFSEGIGNYSKGLVSYLTGASIPFIFKHSENITNYFLQVKDSLNF